ncbi:hypothetical protein [Pararhizobium sp. DWP3-4]|uniref:hypothetical protein n=1 Tax=Pararhizobium sp. DWP3-4 TaxID=2804565 RepID=UPI003CF95A63
MANEFAKWEVAEQETIADIMMEMGNKAKGALKPPTDSEVEAMLAPKAMLRSSHIAKLIGDCRQTTVGR